MNNNLRKKSLYVRSLLWISSMMIGFGMISGSALAQSITIGAGTLTTNGTTADPLERYYNYEHFQIVWTAAELSAAGLPVGSNITGMGFSVSESAVSLANFTISMAHTAQATANPMTPIASLTTVRTPFTYNPVVQTAGNFDMITFTTPFVWNGSSNIVVNTCTGSNPFTSPYGGVRYTTGATVAYQRNDGTSNCNSVSFPQTTTNRPNIRFNYIGASPCTGTPNPGNTIASATSVCSGVPVNLSLQNNTVGTGVSYQWQSGPTTLGPWINIGTNNASITVTQSAATAYRCMVTCSGNTGTSNPVLVNQTTGVLCVNYCPSNATSAADEEITNVTFGTLNNSSGCATLAPGPGSIVGMYGNYKSGAGAPAVPSVQQLQSVPFAVTQTSCGGAYSNSFDIYIDYNQNGLFTDAGELVFNGPSLTGNHTDAGNITIPLSALAGQTVMRVVNVENGATSPCGTYTWGETEDYVINITVANVCTGTPAPGNTVSSASSACTGVSFTLSLQNSVSGLGISYQWQNSINGGATWNNISGATSSTYTTTQTIPTSYRANVSCSFSAQSAFSNPLLVTMELCYCASNATSTADDEILNVTLGSLNNTSACGALAPGAGSIPFAYSNYRALPAPSIMQSSSYPVSLTLGYCNGSAYSTSAAVFIDFDQSGVFDASERVYNSPYQTYSVGGTVVSGNIQVPNCAIPGLTTMRVVMTEFSTNPAACGTYTWGETEDYSVNILAAPTVVPVAANVSGTQSGVCNTAFNFSVASGYAGSIQWQTSTSSSGPFTDVTGSNGVNYTLTPAGPGTIYVRARFIGQGCVTDAVSNQLTVIVDSPVVNLSTSTASNDICRGTQVTITAGATGPYNWSNGSTTQSISVTPLSTTTYSVATGTGLCTGSGDITINIIGGPIAAASGSPAAAECPGVSKQLNANLIAGPPSTGNYTVANIPYAPQSGSGTTITLGDDQLSAAIPIPFAFNYYGNTFNNLYISSNGYISFDATAGAGCCTGVVMPNSAVPNNIIALQWEDFLPSSVAGSSIEYFSTPTKMVVRYTTIGHYSLGLSPLSGQIELNSDGTIEMHILSAATDGDFVGETQGIENANGTLATAVPGRNGVEPWSASNNSWMFTPPTSVPFTYAGPVTYSWTGTNGFTSSSNNTVDNPVATTTYTLVVSDNLCSSSSTVVVPVLDAPVVTTSTLSPYCENNSIQFYTDGSSNSGGTPATPGSLLVNISGTVNLDEVTWNIKNAANVVIASGGPYAFGSTNNTTVNPVLSDYPVTFFIETQGTFNDNVANYSVTCSVGNAVLTSGTLNGGLTYTSSPYTCTSGGSSSTFTYMWSGPNGFTSNLEDPSIGGATLANSGLYTVTITDASGCTSNFTTDIVVNANPVMDLLITPVSCQGFNDGSVEISVNNGDQNLFYFISDEIGNFGFSNPQIFTGYYDGSYPYLVQDGNNCFTNDTIIIGTVPNVGPAISCVSNISIDTDPGSCGAVVTYATPVGTDACPDATTAQIAGLASGTLYPLGTTTNTFVVTDVLGLTASCSFTVTVTDNEAPAANCNNLTVQLNSAGTGAITVAQVDNGSSDACGVQSVTASPTSFTCANVGANTVILTVTDNNGNVSTCSSIVTVEDNVAPVALCQNLTVQLSAAGTASITTSQIDNGSSDACGIQSLTLSHSSFTCSNVGANTVILTVTDNNGNVSTCSSVVTVQDNVLPVALCQNLTVQLSAAGTASLTAAQVDNGSSDACGIQSLAISQSNFSCANVGANTVILTVTDNNGNVSTCSSIVTVQDNVAPVALCQNLTIQLSAAGTASITTSQIDNGSSDACGIQSIAISQSSFTCANVGANTVILTVTDNNGNVSTCSSTVTVEDNVAPVALCQNVTVQLSASGTASITASQVDNGSSDACGIQSITVSPNSFTCANLGANTVTLTVTDNNGNVSTCTSTVTVQDNTTPLISCTSNISVVNNPGICGAVITYAAPVASDNCSYTVTLTAGLASGSTFPIGTTVNTFVVTDAAGNTASCSFNVTVTDNQAPAIANCPVNFATCNPVTWTPPTVTDNCPGVQVVSSHTPGTIFPVGNTTVTYTATDVYNNVSTCSFVVTVQTPSIAADSITSNREYNNICLGENITLSVNGGVLGFQAQWKWYRGGCGTAGGGVLVASNVTSITVAPTTTTTYYVRAEGTCNNTACQQMTVTVSAGAPTANVTYLSVPAFGAPGVTSTITVNTIPGATYYRWTTNNGQINGVLFNGQLGPVQTTVPTVQITFVLPQSNYQLRVTAGNACGRTNQANTHIRGTVPAPTSLTGPTQVCPGQTATYTVSAVPSAGSYIWALIPASAGTISGSGLTRTITFAAGFTSAQLCVNGVSNFGLSGAPLCISISTSAPSPVAVSGNPNPCQGSTGTYTTAAVTGATSYIWSTTVPGATISGTTTSASVVFPAGAFTGTICVQSVSSCGTSAATCMTVTSGAPGVPGPITGPVQGICNASNVNYAIAASAGAIAYNWVMPTGASIASGGTSNSVNVNFLPGFTSGTITVNVTYACGTASSSISVDGAPSVPTVNPATICPGTDELYFASAVGATSFNWTVTGQDYAECTNPPSCSQYYVIWGATGGSFSVTASNTCGTSAPLVISTNCRISENTELDSRVYPNPTSGMVTVEFTSASESNYTIRVTDLTGRELMVETVKSVQGLNQHEVNLTSFNKGIYMLHLNDAKGNTKMSRVAVQ